MSFNCLGPGDIKDLNAYADHWGVIKASLTAGMYPNVAARLDKNHLCVHQGAATKISENSVAKETTHDWYIFDAKNSMNEDEIIEGVTAVTPVTVFMFAGHNRLPRYVREPSINDVTHLGGRGDLPKGDFFLWGNNLTYYSFVNLAILLWRQNRETTCRRIIGKNNFL